VFWWSLKRTYFKLRWVYSVTRVKYYTNASQLFTQKDSFSVYTLLTITLSRIIFITDHLILNYFLYFPRKAVSIINVTGRFLYSVI